MNFLLGLKKGILLSHWESIPLELVIPLPQILFEDLIPLDISLQLDLVGLKEKLKHVLLHSSILQQVEKR